MKAFLLTFILLCLFCTSCKTQKSENEYAYINIFIPDSLFKFYPKTLDNLEKDIYSSNAFKDNDTFVPFFDYSCFHYLKSYKIKDIEDFNTIFQSFRVNIIDSIDIVNDNYSVIGTQFDIEKQLGVSMNILNYQNFNKNKILFSFNDLLFKASPLETKCGLSKSYKMYVLMKGYEFVLPQKYYSDNTFLPEGYRHGYLSGVAFSIEEQKIIYWTCAW